nr:hypothetical protein Iba_scaffold17804CG0220 [Ipomoea batatas]
MDCCLEIGRVKELMNADICCYILGAIPYLQQLIYMIFRHRVMR